MLGVKRLDHVSMATDDLEGRATFFQELFGMEVFLRFEQPHAGLHGLNLRIPGTNAGFELITPNTNESFVSRFLSQTGPRLHHLTFEIEDAEAAARELRQRGIEPFGEGVNHGWKELFIHPRDTGGVLIQLYELVGEITDDPHIEAVP